MSFYSDSQTGTIEFGSNYERKRKPVWLIGLKLLGSAAMIAIGMAIAIPSVPLPFWRAVVVVGVVQLLYVLTAFFIRPEPNTDNLGWMGGAVDDIGTLSDNVNRHLVGMHMILGPGRFVAGSFVDVLVLCGIGDTSRPSAEKTREEYVAAKRKPPRWNGSVDLESTRFMNE